ncbi:PilN domain-containing protein [Candidatus Methylocalor cossyra]|uniref:Type IV pilus inner membrane component PilN n=1 Tax=Candidatus Methylocalor cossyra TaxID=3108543 RepID=A0ABM9NJC6_9GAMM
MTSINLLPWRAERRKQKQKEFFSIVALALLVTTAVLMAIHVQIAATIDYQNRRNEYLTSELAILDKKIKEIEDLESKKKRLIAKMDVIQRLQSSRPEIVHLFDELARTVPEGVYLTDLTQSNNTITMNGMAQSNGRVSAYMRNLESSPWLHEPILNIIETKADSQNKKDQRGSKFTLQVKQAEQKAQAPGKGAS